MEVVEVVEVMEAAPTDMSAFEVTGPACNRTPATRTPGTSATSIAAPPLSGMSVASPEENQKNEIQVQCESTTVSDLSVKLSVSQCYVFRYTE